MQLVYSTASADWANLFSNDRLNLLLDKEYFYKSKNINFKEGCPCGIIDEALDCGIIVSEFELRLRYYVQFQTTTLGKDMNPLIFPVMG